MNIDVHSNKVVYTLDQSFNQQPNSNMTRLPGTKYYKECRMIGAEAKRLAAVAWIISLFIISPNAIPV